MDAFFQQVADQVAEVVFVAAGEADSAADQLRLALQAEHAGPLRMVLVGQEGQRLDPPAVGQTDIDTRLDIGLGRLFAFAQVDRKSVV